MKKLQIALKIKKTFNIHKHMEHIEVNGCSYNMKGVFPLQKKRVTKNS